MATVSAIRPADLGTLGWQDRDAESESEEVPLPFDPCEARVVKWMRDAKVTPGERRSRVFHVVLTGLIQADREILSPGSVLVPQIQRGIWSVREDTHVLTLQADRAGFEPLAVESLAVSIDDVPWREFFCAERGFSHELHPHPRVEVKLIRYLGGATIPEHYHTGPTLSTLARGRVETPHGVLGVGSIFWCRGVYGPWNVLDDLVIVIAQSRGTQFVPTAFDKQSDL